MTCVSPGDDTFTFLNSAPSRRFLRGGVSGVKGATEKQREAIPARKAPPRLTARCWSTSTSRRGLQTSMPSVIRRSRLRHPLNWQFRRCRCCRRSSSLALAMCDLDPGGLAGSTSAPCPAPPIPAGPLRLAHRVKFYRHRRSRGIRFSVGGGERRRGGGGSC